MTERQQTRRRERRRAAEKQAAPESQAPATPQASSPAEQVSSLLTLSSYLVSVLDPREILASLVSRLVEALPSVQAGILWIDHTGRLRPSATVGLPLEAATAQLLTTAQLRSGEGLAGLALQRGEPQIVETPLGYRDTAEQISSQNQGLFQQLSEQLPHRLTAAAVPLRVGAEIVGVIELLNLGQEAAAEWRPLEQADIPMLQTFGNLAAAALKNAELYAEAQRSERRLKAFDAVVTAISTAADLPDLVRSVLDVVVDLLPGACGALLLLEPAHDRLDLTAQHGLAPGCIELLRQLPVVGSPCEEVVHYGQPTQRPLLAERGEGPCIEAGLAAGAYFPLLAGGTVAGVLALYGDSSLNQRADKELLMPICNQVGFAIANVRLYADSQSERRKLNTVVTSIAEGVLLCDAMGRLTLANDAALTLLRLDSLPFEQPLTEMPGFYRMRDLDGQPLEQESQLPFARALAGELFQDYRLILRGASGDETVMSFSGAPARADDGTIEGAVVVFRDITASQKLERAKDEFLAVAAHELRSPLAAVRSYADLLLRREQQREETDPRDLHGLTILTQQVSHMLRMVDNLLDVSRIDAGQLDLQPQRVNLISLAKQVIDQQQPSAGGRELTLEDDADELYVECDSMRIRQVLTNLVGNAIKYGPPGSRVTVSLRRIEEGDEKAKGLGGPGALVCVSDTGAGIGPEQQAKLFQRYYRARSSRAEGLGLGLYLSRQFVQMHGGRIWVESSEGAGSTFAFNLPLEQGRAGQATKPL
jgi:two-component system phosphate regulon sensor histidine kinase PhoR